MLHLQHMLLFQHPASSVGWIVCLCAFSCASAQPAQRTVFEVASVKPAPSQSGVRVRASMRGGPGTADPEQIAFTNVTLTNVLLRAFDVKTYQLTGPEWISAERYEIIAKIPPGTTKEQFNLMLQNLLAERFHLAVHHETKELQGYELVTGRGGPKLKPSTETGPDVQPTEAPKTDANGFPQLSAPGLVMMEAVRGKAVVSLLTARAQPLSALVEMLSKEFRLPVVDKTGLPAKFDFTLEFAPQAPGPYQRRSATARPPIGAEEDTDGYRRHRQGGQNSHTELGLLLRPDEWSVPLRINYGDTINSHGSADPLVCGRRPRRPVLNALEEPDQGVRRRRNHWERRLEPHASAWGFLQPPRCMIALCGPRQADSEPRPQEAIYASFSAACDAWG
jgi:uncharacterized protein (TIGR03435 family)